MIKMNDFAKRNRDKSDNSIRGYKKEKSGIVNARIKIAL